MTTPTPYALDPADEERLQDALELMPRTGARGLEVGYLRDDVPAVEADWYAHAQYQGARIIAEHHTGPVDALEALAVKLLTGAQCVHCKGLVALTTAGALFYPSHLVDGTPFTEAEARTRPQCQWRRVGTRWIRGCETTYPSTDKEAAR